MKLLGTESGRGVQLVRPDEVRSELGADAPPLIGRVVERYGFAKIPDPADVVNQPAGGVKFERGRFVADGVLGTIAISELGLYGDGVVATCANTDLVDLLIDDVMKWLIETGTIRRPITHIPRTYFSNLAVQFDKVPKGSLERVFKTTERYNAALHEQYGWTFPTNLARIQFSPDPLVLPPHRGGAFFIERRAGVPFEENWFYSSAPLRTEPHLRLLEGMEQDLLDI